jgi:hypothetical protein
MLAVDLRVWPPCGIFKVPVYVDCAQIGSVMMIGGINPYIPFENMDVSVT